MATEVNKILLEIEVNSKGVVKNLDQVNKQLGKVGVTAKATTTEVSKAAKAMQQDLAGSAGIAGAAATELGRTISDLPFGISAITNNISQLGNMFALLVTAAGGVTNAIKAMRIALSGPVGILVAFQAVVAGIEMFAQAQRKAKKETDDLKDSIEEINELYGNQRALLIALGDAAAFGSESQRRALAENMKEVKDFLEAAETTGEITSQVIDEAVKLGLNLIEARRNAAIAEKEYLDVINTAGRDRTAAAAKFTEATAKVVEAEKALNLEKQDAIEVTAKLRKEEELLLGTRRFAVIGKDLIDGPELTEAQKIAEDALGKVGAAAVKGFQDRVKSEGEKDWFTDAFGFSKEQFEKTAKGVQQGLDAAFGLINAGFERDLALEERKTIALNDQLKARLANEKLTAEQRDAINQEIARNEAELIQKQNEIEKKRFNLNKAQAVSNAVVNTAVAVSKVLPNFPLAAAVGTLGAAQVATIMAQTFVPKEMPTPNLTAQGTTSGEGLSPAFNVVGATQLDQLSAAVEMAMSKYPIKSYVVSSDVTTAQQLDRNIIQSASI